MSIKVRTAYSLICDGCQKEFEDGNAWTIWSDKSDLVEVATDSEWTTDGTLWHCWDCPMLAQCECCKQPAGEYPGERDGYCQICWDSIEADEGVPGGCTVDHQAEIRAGHLAYERPQGGFVIDLVQNHVRRPCCEEGHKTRVEALDHGNDQIAQYAKVKVISSDMPDAHQRLSEFFYGKEG